MAGGEERAFKALYKRYFHKLHEVTVLKIGDVQSAEEIVQDVFVSTWKQKQSLYPDNLDGYLFIALRNKIYSFIRKRLTEQRRLAHIDTDQVALPIHSGVPDVEIKELAATLNSYLDKLPPQCRTVFTLSRQQQLSNKEIAERLNISVKAVEQHITKALRILRGSLNEYEMLIILLGTNVVL